jgi:hypothetical protein
VRARPMPSLSERSTAHHTALANPEPDLAPRPLRGS